MEKKTKRYSLAILFFAVFALIILINFSLIYLAANRYRQNLIQSQIEEKVRLAESISKTVVGPRQQENIYQQISRRFIKEIAKTKDIIFVRVARESGTIELSSIENEEGKYAASAENISKLLQYQDYMLVEEIFDNERIFTIFYPAEKKLILLGFSTAAIERPVAQLKNYNIFINALGASLFLLLLAIFFWVVVRPVKRITAACEDVKRGDLNTQINIKSKTEIGELVATFNDMTKDLKRSHQFLEEARAKAEEEKNKTLSVITNLVDGLLVFDKNDRLDLMNAKAEKFLALKKENILDKTTEELKQLPTFKRIIQLIEQKPQKTIRQELSFKKELILEVAITPLIINQRNLGTIIILHDITREKLIEKMKTEFVSLAAHQLRTPLSAIKWTLRMILDGDLGQLKKNQRDFLEKTYNSNQRMIHLINDLLNVARIEEGRFLYQLVPTQLEDVISSTISSFEEKINKKEIQLIYNALKEKLPLIKTDPEKIGIAITNLLDNAIDYTPKGGRITISLSLENDSVKFTISDTGVGIPQNQQERIFTKFFRGENVVRMDTEGTGLGMFITKNIIEAHGGKIWFRSQENKGTTFYFTIPINNKMLHRLTTDSAQIHR